MLWDKIQADYNLSRIFCSVRCSSVIKFLMFSHLKDPFVQWSLYRDFNLAMCASVASVRAPHNTYKYNISESYSQEFLDLVQNGIRHLNARAIHFDGFNSWLNILIIYDVDIIVKSHGGVPHTIHTVCLSIDCLRDRCQFDIKLTEYAKEKWFINMKLCNKLKVVARQQVSVRQACHSRQQLVL